MAPRLTEFQRNIVGPFRLLGRFKGQVFPDLPGLAVGEGIGKVWAAFRRSTGRRALVILPEVSPRADWTVRVEAKRGPDPFLALEFHQAPEVEVPASEIADGLDALASVLEDLENRPAAAQHVTGRRVRPRWARRARRAAGPAAVVMSLCVTILAWWHPLSGPTRERRAAPQLELASIADGAALEAGPLATVGPPDGYRRRLEGNNIPKSPKPGQARPDKDGKCERFEVPINGGCWVKLDGKAPCGRTAYEYEGGCYRTAMLDPTSRIPPTGPGPLTAVE